MSRILFVHGWSFDATLWNPVLALLRDHACATVDLGYSGHANLEVAPLPGLVVAHSFGCLWVMTHPALRGVPLVAVNGFSRFSQSQDFPHGVPVRVLDRMLARLAEDPAGVVGAFRERIGAPVPSGQLDVTRLMTDLRRLRDEDARSAPDIQLNVALASEDDPLVPLAMAHDCFPARLQTCPRGGHLLPLTEPLCVAAAIRTALAGVAS